jgi:T5SS/PEP-CTERM-associated repeat protein
MNASNNFGGTILERYFRVGCGVLVFSLFTCAHNSAWAQVGDLNISSPVLRTGDDNPLAARILTVSSVPVDNASLSLSAGTVSSSGANATVSTLVIGGADGGYGGVSVAGGSDLKVAGSNSLYTPDVSVSGLSLREGSTYIAVSANSLGTLQVSGVGSTWESYGAIIGRAGVGNFILENGATATTVGGASSGLINMGSLAGSLGTATLRGSGSTWNAGLMFVGYNGEGRINVSDGAVLSNIGATPGANIQIGNLAGSLGIVNVSSGGAIYTRDVMLGTFAGSEGRVSISGAGSRWIAANESFAVGIQAKGTLIVENGGSLSSEVGWIGGYTGSQGNALITGIDSSWTTTKNLEVWIGDLTVSDNALVSVGETLVNWGKILVETGGQLQAGKIENNGELVIKGGGGPGDSIESVGGVVTATGSLTNFAGSKLEVQSGGTLEVNSLTNSGTLVVNSGGAITSRSNFILNGGTAEINGSLNTVNLTLNGGTLQGTGSIVTTTTDKLTIGSGSTLRGNLTVNGDVEVAAGGKLAPGNSPGTINVGGTLVLNGEYQWEVDGNQADLAVVAGNVQLGGTLSVLPLGLGIVPGQTYSLFAYKGTFSGNFAPLAGYQITVDNLTGGVNASGLSGYKFANITAVPEPGTLLPLSLFALALGSRSRRRRELRPDSL